MKMSDMIKFYETKKKYLQIGLGKKHQADYDSFGIEQNLPAKEQPGIPATFLLGKPHSNRDQETEKRKKQTVFYE